MKIDKKLQQLSKRGSSILNVLTKAEADLEAHIETAKQIDAELEQEILQKELQREELSVDSRQYEKVLNNIKTLLGK